MYSVGVFQSAKSSTDSSLAVTTTARYFAFFCPRPASSNPQRRRSAGFMLAWSQSKICADVSGPFESRRTFQRQYKTMCGQWTDAGDLSKAGSFRICVAAESLDFRIVMADLLRQVLNFFQDRHSCRLQHFWDVLRRLFAESGRRHRRQTLAEYFDLVAHVID